MINIYQIEITNHCNLNCSYCPRTFMKRKLGIMDKQVIDIVSNKIKNNTVRLHHYGESLIAPSVVYYAIKVFKEKNINTILNTNGTLLTPEVTRQLFNNGLQHINLSYHSDKSLKFINEIENKYRNKITILKITNEQNNIITSKLQFLKSLGYNVEYKILRDLGQIKKEGILKEGIPTQPYCSFLKNNEVAILQDGTIVPCCECFDDNYTLGNILDTDIIENKFFEMCKTCNGYGNEDFETERIPI